jgi:hypothetical protein
MIERPECVLDDENSYWFKCLIKARLDDHRRETVKNIAATILRRVANDPSVAREVLKPRIGSYRPLIV